MRKILFIDRDGTLIVEPEDFQIDALDKLSLIPDCISALLEFKSAGYEFVLVSNQDGLGTQSFPEKDFWPVHNMMLEIFESQGIEFSDVLVCPHLPDDGCDCRKPKIGLVLPFLKDIHWDRKNSYVIGDRDTDLQLAENMGIRGFKISPQLNWPTLAKLILNKPRTSEVQRKTAETDIQCYLNLDDPSVRSIQTGIAFFDHMLDQLAKHGQFGLDLSCEGDHQVDDHHSIEDVAIVLGQAMSQALSDKRGIGRYGFVLPMDEVRVEATLDLSGRSLLKFEGQFSSEMLGQMHAQMVEHFFRSFTDHLQANLHIRFDEGNAHHQAEGIFKAVAQCLKQACQKSGHTLPSTKGVL